MNTLNIPGVSGGEPHRAQSPPARISDLTSPSHPSFTPSIFSSGSRSLETGVGKIPQVEGGLLTVLALTDKGGVEGYGNNSVSRAGRPS